MTSENNLRLMFIFFLKNNIFQLLHGIKKFVEANCTKNMQSGEMNFASASLEGF